MKVSTRNIKEIKKRLDYIYDNFNIDPPSEDVKVGDDYIYIAYPDEYDGENSNYTIEDFYKYTDSIDKINVIETHSVICGNIRQTIININEYHYEHLVPDIILETANISIKIVSSPFLIGIVASKDGCYNEDFGISPCSQYMAIELEYKDESYKVHKDKELELIKRYLYYISSQYKVPTSIGSFAEWEDITEVEPEDDKVRIIVEELMPYSKAMDYYVEALSIANNDIKFLHFYKIIEFFSPMVSKKRSYEQLNQRLDMLHVSTRDHKYLDSIFQLTREYEVSLKDRELAHTVLNECIDILSIFDYLPETIKSIISRKCKFNLSEYGQLKPDKVEEIKREISTILYSTRNSIVHAKSNYKESENECPKDDLDEFNVFMEKLCHCLIVWNGRQPIEFQVK